MEISPSILNVKDLSVLKKLKGRIHIDVMDGKFVKGKTRYTPAVVKKIKGIKDVHLMTLHPERQFLHYKKAGAKIINFHIEIGRTAELIALAKKHKLKVGLAVNPSTKIEKVFPYLDGIDEVLIMTVKPGRGGQKFIDACAKKTKILRKKTKDVVIKVDGGINDKTIKKVDADIAVVGHYLFQGDPVKRARTLK